MTLAPADTAEKTRMLEKLWRIFDAYSDDRAATTEAYLDVLRGVPHPLVSCALDRIVRGSLAEPRRRAPSAQEILRACALIHYQRRQAAEGLPTYSPTEGAILPDLGGELRRIASGSPLALLSAGSVPARIDAGALPAGGVVPVGSAMARSMAAVMRQRVDASLAAAREARRVAAPCEDAPPVTGGRP